MSRQSKTRRVTAVASLAVRRRAPLPVPFPRSDINRLLDETGLRVYPAERRFRDRRGRAPPLSSTSAIETTAPRAACAGPAWSIGNGAVAGSSTAGGATCPRRCQLHRVCGTTAIDLYSGLTESFVPDVAGAQDDRGADDASWGAYDQGTKGRFSWTSTATSAGCCSSTCRRAGGTTRRSIRSCRDFLGGYGLGARILYERMPAGADPLGPDNMLGSVTGPFTGTPASPAAASPSWGSRRSPGGGATPTPAGPSALCASPGTMACSSPASPIAPSTWRSTTGGVA